MGGNYDPLFIGSHPSSVGFIYKSLGCFHSLQPGPDPFQSPSVPALTPQGFVRWQTVQLLLGPEEHVPYLQEAVRKFELVNAGDGGPFPKALPAECLPARPDREMLRWHESVAEKLRLESEGRANGVASPSPRARGYGSETAPGGRAADPRTVSDAAEFFQASPVEPGAARRRPQQQGSGAAAPAAPPPIRTRFQNLNFSSTHSPHARPPHLSPASPSPTAAADRHHAFPTSPHLKPAAAAAAAVRHVLSSRDRHKSRHASSNSSSPSPRGRSPSPPRRPRHHGRARTHSATRSPPRGSRPASPPPQPPRPQQPYLARPAERMQRRHSAQGAAHTPSPPAPPLPERSDPHARRRSHAANTGAARGPHGLSPPFYAQQPGPGSRPASQAGPSPGPGPVGAAGLGPGLAPGSQLPPPAMQPLQQVRSAPLQQGPFAPGGYRYSAVGYAPARPSAAAPGGPGTGPAPAAPAGGGGMGTWRARDPAPSVERGGGPRSSSSGTRFAPDSPLRGPGEDSDGREEGRRRRADRAEERSRDKERAGPWQRRSRERAEEGRSR